MPHISIPAEYKKLYARTLNLGIGPYLITNRCSNLLLEYGTDELFHNCLNHVMSQSGIAVLAAGWTGDHKNALGLFIAEGFRQTPFLKTFISMLLDFAKWLDEKKETRPDFLPIVEALGELGAPTSELEHLRVLQQSQKKKRMSRPPVPAKPVRVAKTKQKSQKSRLFIGSSREALKIAEALQTNLDHDFECTTWNQGVFGLSKATIEELEAQLMASDFAVLVVTPDDLTESRGKSSASPRDNVIFELGLFMGAIGRQRTFIVRPRSIEVKMPSDLFGVTAATYEENRSDNNMFAATGAACTQIKTAVEKLGPRRAK